MKITKLAESIWSCMEDCNDRAEYLISCRDGKLSLCEKHFKLLKKEIEEIK